MDQNEIHLTSVSLDPTVMLNICGVVLEMNCKLT